MAFRGQMRREPKPPATDDNEVAPRPAILSENDVLGRCFGDTDQFTE